MVYGEERLHRLRAAPRGDMYSGTLRDGNHKPTIPSAGASGLNCSTHHGVVVPVEQQSATEIDGLPVIPKMIKQSLQTGDDGEEDTDRSGEELSEDDPDPSADP